MKAVGTRLRYLREGIGASQARMAEMLGSTQSSVNRFEHGQATPSVELFRKYADIFDVSLDYIFCRTDAPEGRTYNYQPQVSVSPEKEAIYKFLETCFQPGSPNNLKLKESMFRLMEENEP
ncbi:MAG: helix-turn-helix transcriptional regulator [Clostridia bacterium]|nr:helix-turn-helix transcriptional regulator [Clostridia bacterium]